MFYSIRIVLLAFLVSVPGMHAMEDGWKEQLFSFVKGAIPVTLGMGVGYFAGKSIKHQYIGTALGTVGGMAIDHSYLGGKEDKSQIARKAGNVLPVVVPGGVLYYSVATLLKNEWHRVLLINEPPLVVNANGRFFPGVVFSNGLVGVDLAAVGRGLP